MEPVIVSGSAHPALAAAVARELGAQLIPCRLGSYPDGERRVELGKPVHGRTVALVQPLGPPVGEHVLELLLLADACRRAGAATLLGIVPYLAYARQDRVTAEGQPLGARVVAEALGSAGLDRFVVVDVHSPVMVACLPGATVHLTAQPLLVAALRQYAGRDGVVVAPDLGAARLAGQIAGKLGLPLAVVQKGRLSGSEVEVRSVAGEVRGLRPILVDDMLSTGGTIHAAARALLERGCKGELTVAATHGLFAGGASTLSLPEIARVIVTDSLPPQPGAPAGVDVVSLAPMLAKALERLTGPEPLGALLSHR